METINHFAKSADSLSKEMILRFVNVIEFITNPVFRLIITASFVIIFSRI